MKYVNINDIEDLIINKYFIEQKLLEKDIISEKHSIKEFIDKYGAINYIYKYKDLQIPFGITNIDNETYIFTISNDKTELSILDKKLKSIKYDINNLTRVNYNDLMQDEHLKEEDFIIKDTDYYK